MQYAVDPKGMRAHARYFVIYERQFMNLLNFSQAHLRFEEREVRQGAIAVAIFLAVYAGIFLLRRHVFARLKLLAARTTDPTLHRLIDDMHRHLTGPEIPVLAFYASTRHLDWPFYFHRGITILVIVLVGYRLTRVAQDAATFILRKAILNEKIFNESALRNITLLTNGVFWCAGGLLVLSNIGFNVSAILTGLGIGGVAVALAAQAALGDIFAAIMIILDRPFVVGDSIGLDKDWQGIVENIGFKTTRVRSGTGELLVIPNSVLTTNKLRNFSVGHRQEKT